MAKEKAPNNLVVGPCRLSYLHVLEPKAIGDSTDKKYSVSIIIPKTNKVLLAAVKKAIEAARELGIAKLKDKNGKVIPDNKLKLPLRDGDDDRDTDPAYKDAYFLNANSSNQPQIVDKARNEITDKSEIYSGMIGAVSVSFFAFDSNGSKGIACGLNNVMKLKDGPKLSSQSTAEEDFADVDFDDMEIGEETDEDEDFSDL